MADDSRIKNKKGSAIINVTNFTADEKGRGLPPQNYKSLGSVEEFLKRGGETYIPVYGNKKIETNRLKDETEGIRE